MIKLKLFSATTLFILLVVQHSVYGRLSPKVDQFEPDHEISIDKVRIQMEWYVDWEAEDVVIRLTKPFNRHYEWFALGFNNKDSIGSNDYCVFFRVAGAVTDGYSTPDGRYLVADTMQQDCRVIESMHDSVLFKRKFNTSDPEDVVFHNGTMRILYARGRNSVDFPVAVIASQLVFSYNQVFHEDSRIDLDQIIEKGSVKVQLLKPKNYITKTEDVIEHDIIVNNIMIPKSKCYNHIVQLTEDFEPDMQLIGFEAMYEIYTRLKTITLYKCNFTYLPNAPVYSGECGLTPVEATKCEKRPIAFWSYGSQPFAYPKDVGMSLGITKKNKLHIKMTLRFKENSYIQESAGLRLRLVKKPRKYEAGIARLGIIPIDIMFAPSGQVGFPLPGFCPSNCTEQLLPKDGVTIFAVLATAGNQGARIEAKVLHKDGEMTTFYSDTYYNNDFQELRSLGEEVKVKQGDSLLTMCYFDTRNYNTILPLTTNSDAASCINYVYYYPAGKFDTCVSTISWNSMKIFLKNVDSSRERDDTGPLPLMTPEFNSIVWDPYHTAVLQQAYIKNPVLVICGSNENKTEKELEDWADVPIETGWKFPETKYTCVKPKPNDINIGACDLFCNCTYSHLGSF